MKLTTAVRAMALSDPQWQSIEPKRELVFPVGQPAGNDDRRWAFTPEDLAAVVAEFDTRTEQTPVLYRHGDDPARGGMAAGWIDRLELAPDGLYAFIRYGERALAEIKDGAWGYRSPGFDAEQDADGAWHPRRLSEVSLVNDPAIAGMPPLKAAVVPTATSVTASTDAPPAAAIAEQEDHTMAVPETVTAAKQKSAASFDKPGLLALIRETYAMPDAVSDEMLLELIGKAIEGSPEKPDEMTPPGAEKKDEAKPADLPFPLGASVKPRIELVEESKDNARIVASVQKAATLGTITPQTLEAAGKLAVADIESFERVFLSPPAPAAGQLINASARDRSGKPQSFADTVRAQRNAAIGAARQ